VKRCIWGRAAATGHCTAAGSALQWWVQAASQHLISSASPAAAVAVPFQAEGMDVDGQAGPSSSQKAASKGGCLARTAGSCSSSCCCHVSLRPCWRFMAHLAFPCLLTTVRQGSQRTPPFPSSPRLPSCLLTTHTALPISHPPTHPPPSLLLQCAWTTPPSTAPPASATARTARPGSASAWPTSRRGRLTWRAWHPT
jgi:hypothetical protein